MAAAPASHPRLFALALLAVVAAGTLAGAEALLRLSHRGDPFATPAPSEIAAYGANPYIVQFRPFIYCFVPRSRHVERGPSSRVTYAINSRGFRAPEPPPRSRRARLVVVGDSVVEGAGVDAERAFPALLDARLRDTGWEVVGCGTTGASPIYYACNAERYLALRPDAVLVVAFDNDLHEDRVREASYGRLPYLAPARLIPEEGGRAYWWLVGKSRALCRLDRLARSALHRFPSTPLERLIEEHAAHAPRNAEQVQYDRVSPYVVAPSLLATHVRMTTAYYDLLRERCRARGVALLWASLSTANVSSRAGRVARAFALDQDAALEAWAASAGVPHLSLVRPIAQLQATRPDAVMLPRDGHPSPAGHALLASMLGPWLRRELPRATGEATRSTLGREQPRPRQELSE